MKFWIGFFKSKLFLYNLVAVVLVLVVGLNFINWRLKTYTKHNIEIGVPDLAGLNVEEAQELIDNKALRLVLSDSIFIAGKPAGVVVKQDPKAFSKVKEDRKIYITINTSNPPMVSIPEMINWSVRSAKEELDILGLIYESNQPVPYLVPNVVRGVKHKGQLLKPGDKLPKGSSVDLLVSIGLKSKQKVPVPNLFGLTKDEAQSILVEHSLNLGHVEIDTNIVKDTPSARIFLQRPLDTLKGNIMNRMRIGGIVDVWLTNDSTIFFELDSLMTDSTVNQSAKDEEK